MTQPTMSELNTAAFVVKVAIPPALGTVAVSTAFGVLCTVDNPQSTAQASSAPNVKSRSATRSMYTLKVPVTAFSLDTATYVASVGPSVIVQTDSKFPKVS